MTVFEHRFSGEQVEEVQRQARAIHARLLADGASEGLRTEVKAIMDILVFVADARVEGVAEGRSPGQATEEITPRQAAEILGMSRPSVMRLIESGHLHPRKVHSRNKLLRREVEEFRRENTRQQRRALRTLPALTEELDF